MKRGLALAVAAIAATAIGCAAGAPNEDQHVEESEFDLSFDRNNVLSDSEFTDSSSLSAADIQAFLADTHCHDRSVLADYSEGGTSAAEMISTAATKYKLNPIEFLVRLQVERSLICKTAASDYTIREALSCGCPDGAPCASKFAGFGRQIDCAGYHFRKYLDDISATGVTIANWGPHKTKMSLDPFPVTPANAATAALYTYTPWVYNGGNNLHYAVWNAIAAKLKYHARGTVPEVKPLPVHPGACGAGDGPSPATGCTNDAQCNHGMMGTAYVCANSGPERGTCIDACHSDADCAAGSTCDSSVLPHSKCTGAPPAVGTGCAADSDCSGGATGSSRVCSNAHKCILGCHSDGDCGAGGDGTTKGICDRGLKTWQCVYRKQIGAACASDLECNGGVGGTQRVCSTTSGLCTDACHVDADCEKNQRCNHATATWSCVTIPDGSGDASCHAPSSCPSLTFPSGVKIQLKKDADLQAAYDGHLDPGEAPPTCFLDVDDLYNPDTNTKYDFAHVMLSAHFSLRELVGTEVDGGWGRRVLLEPSAVAALEAFRVSVGTPFSPTSGFRSPKHQEKTCLGICGATYCPGKCARTSRHLHGDAFDLPYEFYSYKYAQTACDVGFKFAYNEAHTHLHVDENPKYASCVIAFD